MHIPHSGGLRITINMNNMMLIFEILGTVAFAISGAIEAMKKEMDMLGVVVLGLVTAVGGGIIRDIITGNLPPVAFQNPYNALIAIGSAFITFLIGAFLAKKEYKAKGMVWNYILLVSDAIGLGTFTVLGIRYVQEKTDYNNVALLLFVGVITGVGGGILRDVFAGNVPYIFRKHVYATASVAGAIAYYYLAKTGYQEMAAVVSLVLVLVLRLLAAGLKWNLPKVHLHE